MRGSRAQLVERRAASSRCPAALQEPCGERRRAGGRPGVRTPTVHVSLPGSAPRAAPGSARRGRATTCRCPRRRATARKRVLLSFSSRRWTSPSRPKNRSACSSSKTCRPRYGQTSPFGLERHFWAERNALDRVDELPGAHGRRRRRAESRPRCACAGTAAARWSRTAPGTPGRRTRKTRKSRSLAARSSGESHLLLRPVAEVGRTDEDRAREEARSPSARAPPASRAGREAPLVEPGLESGPLQLLGESARRSACRCCCATGRRRMSPCEIRPSPAAVGPLSSAQRQTSRRLGDRTS